jgi:hypothetical protein
MEKQEKSVLFPQRKKASKIKLASAAAASSSFLSLSSYQYQYQFSSALSTAVVVPFSSLSLTFLCNSNCITDDGMGKKLYFFC